MSFNSFALLFTYTLGLIIAAISFSLEPTLEYLHRKRGYANYAHLEWTTNSVLQLHRLIHDDPYVESPAWSCCVDTVPTTVVRVPLLRLDVNDTEHPRLKRLEVPTTSPLAEETGSCPDAAQAYNPGGYTSSPTSQVDITTGGENAPSETNQLSRQSSHTDNSVTQG